MAVHSRFESRFGIAFRLAAAFGAVAILAVGANLIAEHGSAVIRRTEIRVVNAPLPVTSEAQVRLAGVHALALAATIERYGRAMRSRLDDLAPAHILEERQAAAELDSEAAAYFVAANGLIAPGELSSLRAGLGAHRKAAARMLEDADERRRLLEAYCAAFETLDNRLKEALDGAWRIFGRVIARQSLIDMSRTLDQMRPRLTGLTAADLEDPLALTALASEEAALGTALQKYADGLARSQGREWLTDLRTEAALLAEARAAVQKAAGQLTASTARFERANQRLADRVRSIGPAGGNPATARSLEPGGMSGRGPATRRQAPRIRSTSEVLPQPGVTDERLIIAWLSGAVLLVLLVICVGTVISIVRPVRRLMAATQKLANGEGIVVIPRGGIKELDALGVSFNIMAERLRAAQELAQEYHGQLEAKVEERTRQLQHLAQHDPLTQLPNRRQLFGQLNAQLEAAASGGFMVGVFFLDLDNFKNINDSMGHVFGDRVLQAFAARLREVCKPFGCAARLGGDEFTVTFERAGNVEEVVAAGHRLVAAFQQPLQVDGRELTMSISVGVSVYPEHEVDAEALLRAADAALFRAKALGRSQLSVFSRDLLEAAASRFTTEQGLRRAVERGEFVLFFQPEVNAATGEAELVEALVRWRLPNGQLLTPDSFLAVAEESGLIGQISDWVVRSAVDAAAQWHRTGWPEVRVAINVSARQLLDSGFVETLQGLVQQRALPPGCIEVELTENVLQTGATTVESLRRLRAAGFGVALDDFGTGYSSLASLEQLPLTRVKLDRSLVASIDSSSRSLAIAQAIIGLCQGLGLEITAEGVERSEQLTQLRSQRGMYIQGFLLSRPVSAADLPDVRAAMPAKWRSVRAKAPAERPLLVRVG